MAIIGQGVQAGLGRVDYTPYLQGAMAGSQGIAQGIAGIGQGIAQGVQGYLQKKEEKRQEDEASQMITGILKTNPGLSSQLKLAPDEQGNFDKGAIKAAIKGAGGPVNAIKLAMTLEELGNQQKARREQQAAASYASLLSQGGGSIPAPISNQALAQFSPEARMAGQAAYLQQARQAAELDKTRAETENLLIPKTKEANAGYLNPEEALKEAERLNKGRTGFAPSFTPVQGRYFPVLRENPTPAYESEEEKGTAKRYGDRMTAIETGIDDALKAAIPASQVLAALDSNQTTGFFAPFTTFVSNVLNLDDAAKKTLLAKGIASLSANQVTTLARGLGSMSNADRDYFAKAAPSITDPTQVNRFYAEMAIQNAKFAQEDRDYINERMMEGIGTRQIYIELEGRRKARNIAKSIYKKATGLSPEAADYLN